MNSIQELPARGTSPAVEANTNTASSCEYRFLVQDEWSSESGVDALAAEGWVVVSYGVRRDNQREYLLKRVRR